MMHLDTHPTTLRSNDEAVPHARLVCALVFAVAVTTLTACGAYEKEDNVTFEQLAAHACEIGPELLAQTDGLKLRRENSWGVGPREGDVDFFGQGDPPWWIQADGRVSLAFDETTTTKELAERMAAALEADGWTPKDPWPGRVELPLTKTDELGTWTVNIAYGTEPPPMAQWVDFSLTSPHTAEDPVDIEEAEAGYLSDNAQCM